MASPVNSKKRCTLEMDWMWSRNDTNLVLCFFQCSSHFFNAALSFCKLHYKKYETGSVPIWDYIQTPTEIPCIYIYI